MNDEFKIQLKVAGKVYPLRCKRSEERYFRRAASIINEKILSYSSAFAGAQLELNDLLVMVALEGFSDLMKNRDEKDTSPLMNKIEDLGNELEEYLKSNQ